MRCTVYDSTNTNEIADFSMFFMLCFMFLMNTNVFSQHIVIEELLLSGMSNYNEHELDLLMRHCMKFRQVISGGVCQYSTQSCRSTKV